MLFILFLIFLDLGFIFRYFFLSLIMHFFKLRKTYIYFLSIVILFILVFIYSTFILEAIFITLFSLHQYLLKNINKYTLYFNKLSDINIKQVLVFAVCIFFLALIPRIIELPYMFKIRVLKEETYNFYSFTMFLFQSIFMFILHNFIYLKAKKENAEVYFKSYFSSTKYVLPFLIKFYMVYLIIIIFIYIIVILIFLTISNYLNISIIEYFHLQDIYNDYIEIYKYFKTTR
jgi:hypothetical protein